MSLRIKGPWYTQTTQPNDWLCNKRNCSFSFWFRGNKFGGWRILGTPGDSPDPLSVNISSSKLLLQMYGGAGFGETELRAEPTFILGQWNHIALSYNADGDQWWSWNGVAVANINNSNKLTVNRPGTFGIGSLQYSDGVDYNIAEVRIWKDHSLTIQEARDLYNSDFVTPSDIYWSLKGVADTIANPVSDNGFNSNYTSPAGTGIGVYSSDDPIATVGAVTIVDPQITRSGLLLIAPVTKASLDFKMIGNNGQFTYKINSIQILSRGKNYSNPKATLIKNNQVVDGILADPIVINGKIIGIGVYNNNEDFLDSDNLDVSITDTTGSGARFKVKLSGEESYITSLSNNKPTIKVNNEIVSVKDTAYCWVGYHSYVAYELANKISSNDIVTWSLPNGSITTNEGTISTIDNQPVANYTGVLEPIFQIPKKTSVGVMHGATTVVTNAVSAFANRRLHCPYSSRGGVSTLKDGLVQWEDGENPYTLVAAINYGSNYIDDHCIPFLAGPTLVPEGGSGALLIPIIDRVSGTIEDIIVINDGSNYPNTGNIKIFYGDGWGAKATFVAKKGRIKFAKVIKKGFGYSDGLWKMTYGDRFPGTPTILTLTNDVNWGQTQIWVDLTGSPSPLGDRCNGNSKAWYNCLVPDCSMWSPEIHLNWSGGRTEVINNKTIHFNGATDVIIAEPNVELSEATGLEPNPNYIKWLTFDKDKYCAIIRFMQAQLGPAADNSAPDYSLLPQPGWWGYDNSYLPETTDPTQPGKYYGVVDSIRPYERAISPKIYMHGEWPGTIPDNVFPYSFTPSDRNWASNNNAIVFECVTKAPHNLKWGHLYYFNSCNLLMQSGPTTPPINSSLSNTYHRPWITGPNSFLSIGTYSGHTIDGLNGVISPYCTQGSDNNNLVSNVIINNAASVDIAPPTNGWRTATAIGVVKDGVLVSVTPVDNGNNYSVIPNVKVITNGVTPLVTANVINGEVTSYTINNGGSGLDSHVGIDVNPPGITATGDITIIDGKIISVTIKDRGAGYVNGPPEIIVTSNNSGCGGIVRAVLTNNSVTSVIIDNPGKDYTQNNVFLSFAPPPTQATAYIDAPNRAVLMNRGFGYSLDPPVISNNIGSATLVFPFHFTGSYPAAGTYPVEGSCKLVNKIPNCAAWLIISEYATDEHIRKHAEVVAINLAPGHKCWIELGNEPWNWGYSQFVMNLLIGKLSNLTSYQVYAARAARMHAIYSEVFRAHGRENDLVRVFSSWWNGPHMTREIIDYANANNIPIDVVPIAPYIDKPDCSSWKVAENNCLSDISWLQLYHELFRYHLLFNSGIKSFNDAHNAILDTYTAGPRPKLAAYEGCVQHVFDDEYLSYCFFSHSDMLDIVCAWHQMCEQGGISTTAYTGLGGPPPGWGSLWSLITHSRQNPGTGTNNKFGDKRCHFTDDASTALAGLQKAGSNNPR